MRGRYCQVIDNCTEMVGEPQIDLCRRKCSDLGVPAPYGRNIAPMRVHPRRGCLIGESQERVARAKPLTGDVGVSPTQRSPFFWPVEGGRGMRSTSSCS